MDEVIVKPLRNFHKSLAVKILHRLLEHFIGYDEAMSVLGFTDLISDLSNPLEESLDLVRQVLRVKDDTKILLCVDEIIIASSVLNVSPSILMRELTMILDKEANLYLSVSAYGAIDLAKFVTNENRKLLLQPLGPIFSVGAFTESNVHLLPKLLQPFYKSELRVQLPFTAEDSKTYAKFRR
jgi:hypothetical protein